MVLYTEDQHRKSLLFTILMPLLLIGVWLVLAVLIHMFEPQGGGM